MARAPYQVLVIPFRRAESSFEFCLLKRADAGYWQFVAGGGEDAETPERAAIREATEELGVPVDGVIRLESVAAIPAGIFRDRDAWPADLRVLPEYAFATEVGEREVRCSAEHTESRWCDFETAIRLLHWESNRDALRELN